MGSMDRLYITFIDEDVIRVEERLFYSSVGYYDLTIDQLCEKICPGSMEYLFPEDLLIGYEFRTIADLPPNMTPEERLRLKLCLMWQHDLGLCLERLMCCEEQGMQAYAE